MLRPDLQAGDVIEGFAVQAVTSLPEMRAVVYRLEHTATGARVLHVHAPGDQENLFSINYPTPPPDDTGLPHILEHAVLAGSKKFRVREPLFEMMKMSMGTLINAMTHFDCTIYPVANNVRQDLFNLAEVHFDAAVNPLLTEQTFHREAHRLAPRNVDNPDAGLTITGIVYNEMKGAFSVPESAFTLRCVRALLPDTACGREGFGDPEHIPELTYSALCEFHARYYHPGNAHLVLYGDIPTRDYLAWLAPRLEGLERHRPHVDLPRQRRWREPRAKAHGYPVGPNDPTVRRSYIGVHWLAGDATDLEDAITLEVLTKLLFGHEAAPLRKAIIDSGLGEDLLMTGSHTAGRETLFHVALQGTEPDRAEAYEKLVLDTLARIADEGFEDDTIESAMRQVSYEYLEVGSRYPLQVMTRVLATWLYGTDPAEALAAHARLDAVKHRWQQDPQYFQKLLRERLLQNPHRLRMVLHPDPEAQARLDRDLAKRVERAEAKLTPSERNKLAERERELDRLNSEPNTPEAVAMLPQLRIADLPAEPRHIDTHVEHLPGGAELLTNEVFANGVSYLTLSFDLRGLPFELEPHVPQFGDAIRKLGAAGMDYQQIARRASAHTGGSGVSVSTILSGHVADPTGVVTRLTISLKTFDEQIEPALALLRDLVVEIDPRDRDRLAIVAAQAQAHYRRRLPSVGFRTATTHAARHFHSAAELSHLLSGLPQLRLAEDVAKRFDERCAEVMDRIERIREFLLVRGRVTASFTGGERPRRQVREALGDWLEQMRDEAVPSSPRPLRARPTASREGLAAPMQVAHAARVQAAPHASDPESPLMAVGTHLLDLDYFLPELRFKGNAYGADFAHDADRGLITMFSAQDPHIARTLGVFDGALDFVGRARWKTADIERAVIGTAKEHMQPIRPDEATRVALSRHLTGRTREWRREQYARMRTATVSNVVTATRRMLETGAACPADCVVSSQAKLEEANTQLERPLEIGAMFGAR